MSTIMHILRGLAALMLAGHAMAGVPPPERSVLPDTTRLLDLAIAARASATVDQQRASRALIRDGDRAYRQHRYAMARRAYANAHANTPNPYAYVMHGDAHWREVLQAKKNRRARPVGTCQLDNRHFAHDLESDVAQHQEVGLALAKHDRDVSLIRSPWYQRADLSTACLRELATFYRAQPSSQCVDLQRLQGCLGKPLIK